MFCLFDRGVPDEGSSPECVRALEGSTTTLAPLPREDAARAVALSALQRAGVNTRHSRISAMDVVYGLRIAVDPEIDHLPTSALGSYVVVDGSRKILQTSGWLGRPKPVARRKLVGAKAALQRDAEHFSRMTRPTGTTMTPHAGLPVVRTIADVELALRRRGDQLEPV